MGYVSSYIRRSGVVVRDHFRKISPYIKHGKTKPPPQSALNSLLLNQEEPVEEPRKEQVSAFGFYKYTTDGKPSHKKEHFTKSAERWRTIDGNGVESVHLNYVDEKKSYQVPLAPDSVFFDNLIFEESVIAKKDLSNSFFTVGPSNCDILKSRLDGSVFSGDPMGTTKEKNHMLINKTSFTGTSLKNVTFDSVIFSSVCFGGADLTGAVFKDCEIGFGHTLDVIGSNITSTQMESIMKNSLELAIVSEPKLLYKRYSFDEAIDATGLSEKQFEFMVLSGALKARNHFGDIVEEKFSPDLHHIAQWDVQDLIDSPAH